MAPQQTVYINKMQEIIAGLDGVISHSNNAIHQVDPGSNIFTLHPFFESLKDTVLNSELAYFTFPCINLTLGETKYYCDIIIKRERSFLAILLFNFSDHYKAIQENVQKINGERLKS